MKICGIYHFLHKCHITKIVNFVAVQFILHTSMGKAKFLMISYLPNFINVTNNYPVNEDLEIYFINTS